MIRPFPAPESVCGELPEAKQAICAAAMRCFFEHGTEVTSLRMVAETAGVSVGLVQHYFGTKAALIKAVDAQLIDILRATAPSQTPPDNVVADVGQCAGALIEQHPEAMRYLAHLLISESPTGKAIFDTLIDIAKARWTELSQQGRVRGDLDATWGPLGPLVLILGSLILRPHIERQLPEPLITPTQLGSWKNLLTRLIEDGQLHQLTSAVSSR